MTRHATAVPRVSFRRSVFPFLGITLSCPRVAPRQPCRSTPASPKPLVVVARLFYISANLFAPSVASLNLLDGAPQLVVPDESPSRDRPEEERVALRIGALDKVSLEADEKTELEREKQVCARGHRGSHRGLFGLSPWPRGCSDCRHGYATDSIDTNESDNSVGR